MTKQHDPATAASDRPALEIEITEEMIAAGASVLAAEMGYNVQTVVIEDLAERIVRAALAHCCCREA